MTHSVELLFPIDHVVQLVELLTLCYFIIDTRSHPCLVVFQLRCFQRLARVLDVLDGVVQDVEARLPIDVADIFNRIADLPRFGGDGLLCSTRGLVQLTDWCCYYDIVISVHLTSWYRVVAWRCVGVDPIQ